MAQRKRAVSADVPRLQILDEHGKVDEALDPALPKEDLRALVAKMVLIREFDERMLRLQRQGRIGTFAPVKGQEAAQLGSIYALRDDDWFVPAFRETAAAMWRGAKMEDYLLYAGGYEEGIAIPETARDLPIAIPVASQCTHAVGTAYASLYRGEDTVTIVYFGDGATSHGDFHEAANFAAVLKAPVIFLCQNNQYAISVPRARQTRSETIAQKAFAYGMPCVQVDGNDLLAVYVATKEARDRARRGEGPTLIEAVTYRMSVHTTADDPKKYRTREEEDEWAPKDPIIRLRKYLRAKRYADEEDFAAWEKEAVDAVDGAVKRYEELRKDRDPLVIFENAWAEDPPDLVKQREAFEAHIKKHGSRMERGEEG